jgi:integrase
MRVTFFRLRPFLSRPRNGGGRSPPKPGRPHPAVLAAHVRHPGVAPRLGVSLGDAKDQTSLVFPNFDRIRLNLVFQTWCHAHARIPLPAAPETIILYATDLTKNQKRKSNTLQRRLAAVSQLHQEAGFPSPTQTWPLKQFLAGLRRELGVAPERKRPLLAEDLREILADLPDTRLGKRDRALLLLGFSGAFRRSELVALDAGRPNRRTLKIEF